MIATAEDRQRRWAESAESARAAALAYPILAGARRKNEKADSL